MNRRVLTFGLAIAAFACGALIARQLTTARQSNRPVNPKLVAANSDFGVRLLKELVKAEPGKNVFISPSSISLALSMTYNGANGTTKDAMAKVLGYSDMSLDEVNAASAAVLNDLKHTGGGTTLEIANSLWARNGVDFAPEFTDAGKSFYSADTTSLPFDPSAVSKINNWVSCSTHGKIDSIIDSIDPQAILFLVNAVYFEGKWQHPFSPADTKMLPFAFAGGKRNVPMMAQRDQMRYVKTQDVTGVCVPYKTNRMGFWVFLPSEKTSLQAVVKKLSAATLEQWVSAAKKQEVDLYLPRFKVECTVGDGLKHALTKMGMGLAFDQNNADFTRMRNVSSVPNIYIGEVVHRTVVDVSEQGTKAAAATEVGVYRMADGDMDRRAYVSVDRPFLCLIRDNKTKAMLFIGVVENPS